MNKNVSQKNLAEATIARVRRVAVQRGGENGIRALSRAFRVMDDDGNQKLSKEEFTTGMKDVGAKVTDEEIKALWYYFDRNGDGVITATEFITALRGGMNPLRRSLVNRAFDMFDKTADGSITIEDLRGTYDASRHPRVLSGEMSEDEALGMFLESFDGQTNPDGIITKQEFEQYFSGVSASIDDDEYFAAMMRGCWKLPGSNENTTIKLALQSTTGGNNNKTFATRQPIEEREALVAEMAAKEEFNRLLQSHRKAMLNHKMGFRGVGRLLRQQDTNATNFLPVDVFLDCLWKNRLYVEDRNMLRFLDTNGDGTVDCALYMSSTMGELPPARLLAVERIWKKLPTDSLGRTDLSVVHRTYQAPDGVALNTFLDAWDARLVPDGKVRFVELLEWIIPTSIKISADKEFEKMLSEQWVVKK